MSGEGVGGGGGRGGGSQTALLNNSVIIGAGPGASLLARLGLFVLGVK